MTALVIDACVLIAYLFDEDGSDFFQRLLLDARNHEIELVMHNINLGEVYYDILKRNDVASARETYEYIRRLPIRFEDRVGDEMIYAVGELKSRWRIAYADAFAAAQAILLNAALLTADRKEFEPLRQAFVLRIEWLR
uniref:Predicted nucleic acid-binding protein, contains PIN domain n=1 Tax=Candidatus Kentrum eta TaxID=2126337 RepID=A0A450ULJ8_9GAMM|nr:MAG: Predicted nucleic acid-binding protein, contains PIN domain [Candidatus Kentron sp. H]VFJ94124.1 MAG: Predicted nucleic acid-binding protein, contains PIN domain [Candidatus Kentron sp. H]VFK06778.1 MAG: Predicted nucleic acid-binding protein, contains PIN domain [Candidatus Kentron sp. H]